MKKFMLLLIFMPFVTFAFDLQTCDSKNIEGCLAENYAEINMNVENYIDFKTCLNDISLVTCINENFSTIKEQYDHIMLRRCSPSTLLCCVNDNFEKISDYLNP